MQYLSVIVILFCLIAALAHAQTSREFNWIPSGNLDIGDLVSENESDYRGMGDRIQTGLVYSDGTRPGDRFCRRTTAEMFTVRIATYRGGPCPADLVIRRCIDTGTAPVELTVFIDGKEHGKWLRSKFEGNRRLADVFYVVPQRYLTKQPDGEGGMKDRISIRLTSENFFDTYRYDFFITRDWKFLPDDYAGAINSRAGKSQADLYVNGLVLEGDHLWGKAKILYQAAAEKSEDFELARCARRRMRRCDYFISTTKVIDTKEEKHFDIHYALGQYCAANGFWNEALAEYTKAVNANSSNADATYNMAEAMEYCRMPVEKYAPLMERVGDLYKRDDKNEITVLCAVNTHQIPGGEGTVKRRIQKTSLDAMHRDWRYAEQMVYGASRGMWKLKTTFRYYGEEDPGWIRHLGWLWAPPTSDIPVWGMYDHTLGFAEYGSSHAGGIDCGPAWSGCCQIGPTRGWQVILHEWNHQFDWTAMCGESGKGYPTTHDSDGCGKQPIVNMGCGHRSSMRYYLTPAQYRRIEPSDPNMPQTHIRSWALFGPLNAPVLTGETEEAVTKELRDKDLATEKDINSIKGRAAAENKTVAQKAKEWFYSSRKMDLIKAVDDESTFRPEISDKNQWKYFIDPDGGRIDLAAIFTDAAPKAYAYAHTYIWSPDDREVRVWYGYHDGLRVWHNNRMVHESRYYNVAYYEDPEWVDMVAAHFRLQKGWNRLLCKIERCAGTGGYGLSSAKAWGFSVNLVNFDNTPITDLKYQAEIPDAQVNVYQRPDVGVYYRWDDVKEDYLELLPQLTEEDFRNLTGIEELTLVNNAFLMMIPRSAVQKGVNAITLEDLKKGIGDMEFEGEKVTPANFLDLRIPGTPRDEEPSEFNKFKTEIYHDITLNNFLNFDREAAAALRYVEDGQIRDLVFIRPEYFEEYLALIDESKSDMNGKIKDRILGYWYINNAAYPSTPNRTWRAIIVARTYLGDKFPIDEQDILAVPELNVAE